MHSRIPDPPQHPNPPPTHPPRDETTVLAFTGLSKVLRAHLHTVYVMDGFESKWDDVMTIAGKVLAMGRKNVAVAAAQLLTSVLQVRGSVVYSCLFGRGGTSSSC
jgi:hypothetical protein